MKLFLQLLISIITFSSFAQTGQLSGRLLNSANGTPVSPAKINIIELQLIKAADIEGRFTFEALAPGL